MKNLSVASGWFKTLLWMGVILALSHCKSKNNVIKPEHKDITQAVYASGKLYPVNRKIVSAKVGGYVDKIYVSVGQEVNPNQPLLTVKSDVSSIGVNMAKNNLDLASVNASENSALLRAAQEDVSNARIKLELDSTNYGRFNNLFQQGATSRVAFDQAKAQYESSKRTLQKARSQLRSLEQRVSLELKNARNMYESQQAVNSDFTVYADRKTRVYDIRPKVGDLIAPQMPLIEVGDEQAFEVELAVDETDISLLKEGQKVLYEIEAMKNKFFEGEVKKLYPVVNPLNKTAKVIATIKVDSIASFFSGMSIEANIIISQKKNALVIPRSYLIDNTYVKVNKGSEPEKVKITKGIEDLEYVEVLGGIDGNTEIVN